MEFDGAYYNSISNFLNSKDNVVYNISDLTDNPDRFIFHVKYYIDNRTADQFEVEFNNISETENMYRAPYSKIRVLEFFEQKVRDAEREKAFAPKNKTKTPGLFQ